MQQQTNFSRNLPFYSLQSKPTCYYMNDKQIFISLNDLSLSIMNIQTNQFNIFGKNLHQKRINCIKQKNNIIITGSNDYTIRLWDRLSGKIVHKFQKPGYSFNCLDISQHILTAAHTSKLAFWDLRKMKLRQQFNQSFNGQITSIQFDPVTPTFFMGCSVDGMINKFDLKQPNQQQAFIWCNKILQCPSKLQFINNITLVSTTNHTLYLLQDEDVKQKITVNNFQQPKHILHSKLIHQNNQFNIQYFSWNLDKQQIQKFRNKESLGFIQNVKDSEIFIPLNKNTIMNIDQQGKVFIQNIQKERFIIQQKNQLSSQIIYNQSNHQQKWQKIQQQQPINKNGFILNKNSSFKNKNKKFKPY